jgi:guanosine-3',5'-bis(diphosphate) 3'-pyrophosphohydrolase
MKFEFTNISDTTGLFFSALSFAAGKHSGQLRKGGAGTPYINHLISVADLLWNTGGIRDADTIIAGILHDTLEDTETSEEEIGTRFGIHTAQIVHEVTDNMLLTTVERRQYQVEHASSLSPEARLVKIADKISNIVDIIDNPPTGWSDTDRIAYVRWGKDVIDRIRGTNSELETAFDNVYDEVIRTLTS